MAIGTYVSFAISQCVCYAQHLTREREGEEGATQYAISWQLGKQHDGWACLSRNAHKLLDDEQEEATWRGRRSAIFACSVIMTSCASQLCPSSPRFACYFPCNYPRNFPCNFTSNFFFNFASNCAFNFNSFCNCNYA